MIKTQQPRHPEEHLNQNKLRLLAVVSFILAIGTALLTYIESSFLEERFGGNAVGFIFMGSYLLTLIALYQLTFLVNRFGKFAVTAGLMTVELLVLLVLAFLQIPVVLLLAFIVFIVSLTLLWVMIDVFVETFSSDVATGTIRGRQLTIMNAGWVITPAFAGFLAEVYGFEVMFLGAALLLLPLFFIFFFHFSRVRDSMERPPHFWKALQSIWSRRSLSHIFLIAFLLQFFYAWMVIYMPLHLRALEFEWMDIGKIFSVMLLPFVLLQYPAGWLADRFLGEKEMLITGFLVMAMATASMFLFLPVTIGGWMVLLFLSRVGAALVEVMRDVYFYKQIGFEDIHLINLFRNTAPFAYMIAPFVATIVLAFVNLSALFFVLGCIMLFGIIFSLRLVDTK